MLLRRAGEIAASRHIRTLYAYHDRTRHTGCIYRKAGFRKDGVTRPGTRAGSWGTRAGSKVSWAYENVSKRRWRLDVAVTPSGSD